MVSVADGEIQKPAAEAFRGWIVLASSFCMVLTFGIIYSYSDFFIPLESEFGWSHALDSTIPAVALAVFSIGCVLSGYLNSKISSRKMCYIGSIILGSGAILSSQVHNFAELMITFGVLSALGVSFVVNVGTALAVKWFARRRGLAVGIAASGSGVGTLAVPPLTKFIVNFDWRIAFIVLGGSFLFLLLFASYFAQGPEDRNEKPYGWAKMSDEERTSAIGYTVREALTTFPFWMIYVMFFLGSFGLTMFLVHAEPFAETVGISQVTAAVAIGVFGAGSLLARVVMGILTDRLGRSGGIIISFIVEFISLATLPFLAPNVTFFFLCSFGVGFGYGGILSDFISLTGDLFGTKSVPVLWGIQETAFGIGGLTGPIVAGYYYDTLHTYSPSFEIAAIASLIALAISLPLSRVIRKQIRA